MHFIHTSHKTEVLVKVSSPYLVPESSYDEKFALKSRNFNTKYGTVRHHLLVAAAITLGAHAHKGYSSQFICVTTLLPAPDVCATK